MRPDTHSSLGRLFAAFAFVVPAFASAQQSAPPPNAAAIVQREGRTLRLSQGGHVFFSGTVGDATGASELRMLVDSLDDRVTQVLKWTARGSSELQLEGELVTSDEGFAAEAEPMEDALVLVRHSDGPSFNRRNRAVYDRHDDWVLSVDFPAIVEITPSAATTTTAGDHHFRIRATGREIALRFRPRFYQKHRGLARFAPWEYRIWPTPVAGWSSWYAFRDKVTERDIHETADVLRERLLPFGFEYLQIDDGYQQNPIGIPEHWLHANAKFPAGLSALRAYIAKQGLKPALWTNTTFHQDDWAKANPQYFLPSPDGGPAYGNWVGYVMDGSNSSTLGTLVRPVYDSLARDGWAYFKVDALRHLIYEGYNSHADYFASKGLDREQVFRAFVQSIRDVIGRDRFMVGSWGPRPELIGILDATRLGDDGFGYGGFAQYNSFNNVVWRNDPDHIELSKPDAYRATTVTALTGSLMMLTDPPSVYRTARVEAARRAAPVPVTLPGQLYDVDPSRSRLLGEARLTMSGSGPRPFEADQRHTQSLFLLDVSRPFERWSVLARIEGAPSRIDFADLGLAPDKSYEVFEFWTKRRLGAFTKSFAAGAIDPRFEVQALCIREHATHPQLLATNRHVTCGGPDLGAVSWSNAALRGESTLVGGDAYALYLSEPAGFTLASFRVEGARVMSNSVSGGVRTVQMVSPEAGAAKWEATYTRRASPR